MEKPVVKRYSAIDESTGVLCAIRITEGEVAISAFAAGQPIAFFTETRMDFKDLVEDLAGAPHLHPFILLCAVGVWRQVELESQLEVLNALPVGSVFYVGDQPYEKDGEAMGEGLEPFIRWKQSGAFIGRMTEDVASLLVENLLDETFGGLQTISIRL